MEEALGVKCVIVDNLVIIKKELEKELIRIIDCGLKIIEKRKD